MGPKTMLSLGVVTLLTLLALIGCAIWQPIGAITVNPAVVTRDYEPVDQDPHPGEIEALAFITGWVEAPAAILIDQEAPDLPSPLRSAQWVPSIAFLVRHPDLGVAILDTGLRAGECDYGLRPVYWVPCRNEGGEDLVSQLQALGVGGDEIRYIIPSHFHGDHISGLEDLLDYTNAPLLLTEATLDTVRAPFRFTAGVPSDMLGSDMDVLVMDTGWRDDPRLGRVFDVFGDGSLKLFETPGHTRGHVSALLSLSHQEFLLTFDAAHLRANLTLQVPSGSVASRDDAVASLATLQALVDANANLTVVFGHEPTQWRCEHSVISLSDLIDECSP